MKTWKERIEDRQFRETGGHPESASFHSRGYHRYFEGWSEHTVTDEKGKKKIERIYTGVYQHPELSDKKRGWIRRTYLLLFIMSVLLFLYASSLYIASNSFWLCGIFQALCFGGYLWLFYTLVNFWTVKGDFTVYEFGQVSSMKKASRLLGILELILAGLSFVLACTDRFSAAGSQILCTALYVFSALFVLMIRIIENRTSYTRYLSRNTVPDDASQIES